MKKVLIALIFISFVILGLIESFLPGYYENQVEVGFRRQVEQLENLDVEVTTHPAFLLLFGKVQRGLIRAQGIGLEGLRIEEIEAHYRNLAITNTPQGVKVAAGTNTYFQAVFLEKDLNQYLLTRYKNFDQLKLAITPTGVTLSLGVVLFNTTIQLQLSGNFTIPDNHTIRFVLEELDIAKVSVPISLLSRILEEIEFDLELEEFPLPLDLQTVRLENDRLIVLGGTG